MLPFLETPFVTSLCHPAQAGDSVFIPHRTHCQRCRQRPSTQAFSTGSPRTYASHSWIKSGLEISFSTYGFKKKKKKLKKPQEQPSQRSLARSLLQRKYVIAVNPKVIECSCGVNVTKKTVEPPGSNETVLEFIHQFVKCQSSSHC